ncbi:lantibiotic dehydratase [Dyadobacter sp. CY312]|uniref:lantibiotic dehydratase n=1 Tax=Dyadobacter sp. CY312 TaxID=2907303 RepID=UPI001F2B785E|nr:lantibiotic dehydratase [Dyadobacter sp. CY312]MCE7044542.1 lantibiotic dehydratase [Dyadobacter sp. CY312]
MKIQSYGFCMVRRPVLSRDVLEDFHARTTAGNAEFESELRRLFSDPALLEGLALSSGPLYELAKLLVQNQTIKGKDKLLASLYKFLIRASSRPTPFGVFAGYFIVRTAGVTQIRFPSDKSVSIHNELDASALAGIKTRILQDENIASRLLFTANSSLYRVGQFYRYIKSQRGEAGQTTFVLTQTVSDPVLERLLTGAKKGMLQSELARIVQAEAYSAAESRAYVASLVEAQILVSSIELDVSGGKNFLSRLLDTLNTIDTARATAEKIISIQKQLADSAPLSQVNASLSGLTGRHHPLESTLHSTLRFNTDHATVSKKVLSKLGSQLGRIGCLAQCANNAELEDFARRFFARYGQQNVPLMTALDYDYGVGYAALSSETQLVSPLLDGIETNQYAQNRSPYTPDLAETAYALSHSAAQRQVMLSDQQLQRTKGNGLPSSFYVLGSFHAQSEQSLDEGDFLFELKGLAGPSAVNLMSRFCADDPQLTRYVSKIMEAEQAADNGLIYAQIAHLPAGKGANVVQRPDLTDVDITYLAAPAGRDKTSINPGDLWISCADGKNLVLSCPSLNRQIIPVLTSAHHYGNGLPVYRFLCDLANQYSISLAWDWGHYHSAAFLPRVQYQQIVLSKASWLVSANQIGDSANSKRGWWKDLGHKLGTPRYFTAGQADQLLLFDSENSHSVALFEKMLKKEGKLRITESLEVPEQGLLSDHRQHFANEFVIPFQNTQRSRISASPRLDPGSFTQEITQIQRQFTVGSEWLYVKIYCAENLSDALMMTVLLALLSQLESRKVIEKWFFIRYQDPDAHIRLRFCGEKRDFWSIVLRRLHKRIAPLLISGMVRSIHTDTYQRETERYSPEVYQQIESVFHADSRAVARSLKKYAQDSELRWLGALEGTDLLLDSFGFDPGGKLDFACGMHAQFSDQVDSQGAVRRQMDQNYRAQKGKIIQMMDRRTMPAGSRLVADFKDRDHKIRRMLDHPIFEDKDLKNRLCSDLIHLFLNRWFDTRQREHEFAVYHYLSKFYRSGLKQQEKIFSQVVGNGGFD